MKFWKTLSSTGRRLSNSHKNNNCNNAGDDGGVCNKTTGVLSSVSTTPALMRRRTNGNRDAGGQTRDGTGLKNN